VEVTVERVKACQAKFSFTVPAEEFAQEVHKALRELGRRLRMKGFRPGHVPPEVVERVQGKDVRAEVAFRFVQKAYQQAVEEQKLRPLAHPRIELGEVLAGADLSRSFELELRPDFDLGTYRGLEVESQVPPVLDEEIEAAIEQARRNQARPEPAGESGLPEDGMALAKVQLSYEGEVVWERDGLRLSPQAPLPGVEAEAYRAALTGKLDGQSVELPVRFPPDFEHEAARNQEGTCRIEIKTAFRILVPSRAELMKSIGVATEEELLAKAREGLEQANARIEAERVESELLERVLEAHEMELPQQMVEQQHAARLAAMREELAGRGASPEELEAELSRRDEEARRAALKSAKAYFVIERIAEAEKLAVSEQEMLEELKTIAQRNRSSFEEVRDFYKEQNLFGQLAMEILERKVRRFLRENAELVAPAA
jgi:trigger factor